MQEQDRPKHKFPPTPEQRSFIDALLSMTHNLILRARAGTGKTTVILMGVVEALFRNPKLQILVCAYNKAIEVELTKKLKELGIEWKQCMAKTIHALGFGLIRQRYGSVEVDEYKVYKLVQAKIDALPEEKREASVWFVYRSTICKLVGLAKDAGFGYFENMPISSTDAWFELADHFDVNGFESSTELEDVVECAKSIYRESLEQTDVIDFSDMVLIPLIRGLRVRWTKDLVFGDEAQDWSRTRQALARKFVRPGSGRMVAVGDDRQAIYGFSGADSEALDRLGRDLGAEVLPLTGCWRCPRRIVEAAQALVPDIQPVPGAEDGTILSVPEIARVALRPTDAILCRNTAPLISIAYQLIRSGVACRVEGRKIGEGLVALATKWKIKTTAPLLDRIEEYEQREIQKALAKNQDTKAEAIEDKCNTLRLIIERCNRRGRHQVTDVVYAIKELFGENVKGVVTLCTYHRAKGREWPRTFLLEHTQYCPSKYAHQKWQIRQEDNLAYVAITRSLDTLVFVGPPPSYIKDYEAVDRID